MYEEQTYEAIMERCLARVPNSIDKREGSILFDALGPACAELAILYTELDSMLDRAFPDTAMGGDLDRKCAERGIIRKAATAAVRKAQFTNISGGAMVVPLGTRFSGGGMNYKVTEAIGQGVFKLAAETPGTSGNIYFGTLLPIDFVEGLAGAELSDVLIPGADEEGDESLRQRYFNSLKAESFGGNVADYIERTKAISGVGGVKVYRAWNGGGTVKLVILDSTFGVPSGTLIDTVQSVIDPTVNAGEGLGLAPIGHVVTVSGVSQTAVNISFTITCENGWNWAALQTYALAAIDAYFAELSKAWAESSALVVRVSQIESRILDLTGVLDVTNTTLNGLTSNLMLAADKIPVRGTVVAS